MFLPHNYVLNGQILLKDDLPFDFKICKLKLIS